MRIADSYDLHEIIRELEMALQVDGIDFELPSIDSVMQEVKRRLNRQYQIDLDSMKLDDVALELGTSKASAMLLLDNITKLHSKLSGYGQILRWRKKSELSLSSINYLGYTEDSLKTALIAMQRSATQPRAAQAVQALKEKLPSIPLCWEKRIILLMVIAQDIGCAELSACIAEILYLGLL